MRNAPAYTICRNYGSDRPAYEADVISCSHCGKCFFLCHSVTKEPLPADAVAERCPACFGHICWPCKLKLNSGAERCRPWLAKIEAMEERYYRRTQYERLGLA